MTTSDKHNNEMIKRFKEVNGLYIEKIYGQDRLAFAMSDTSDLYDLIEFAERGGYQGSVIKFYDFENGNVYTPFQRKLVQYTGQLTEHIGWRESIILREIFLQFKKRN